MIELWRRAGERPAPLPFRAIDVTGRSWTDLESNGEGRHACGFVLFGVYDPNEQIIVQVGDDYEIQDRPPEPEPEPVVPQPRSLGKLEFIRLAQSAGGMTDAMLVAAQGNPMFAAFWIKFQMASGVERDDEITATALGALAQGGYLPDGPAAVIDAWPLA